MTIQEAIKSGKPFKSKRWTDNSWLFIAPNGYLAICDELMGLSDKVCLKEFDIISDDWEIKE